MAPMSGLAVAVEPFDQLDPRTIAEWDDLADAVGAPLFVRPGWARCWGTAFVGRRQASCAVLVRERGSLAAALPVVRTGNRLQSATNDETVLWQPVLSRPEIAGDIAGSLLERDFTRLSFRFVPASADWLPQLVRRGFPHRVRPIRASPVVSTAGSWDDYWSLRPRKVRSDHRRRWRRLEETGAVTFSSETGSDQLDRSLQEGFELETRGWKRTHGTAVLSDPQRQTYYWGLARWCAERGRLRLHFLKLDNRAIAFSFLVADGDVWYGLKLAYDPTYRAHGPGTLLIERIAAEAFAADGVRSYHLGGEADSFKATFADGADSQIGVDVYRDQGQHRLHGVSLAAREVVRDHASRHLTLRQRQQLAGLADRARRVLR